MAVKLDSNHTTIIYYCNTIVIVNDSTVVLLFTIVLEGLVPTSNSVPLL